MKTLEQKSSKKISRLQNKQMYQRRLKLMAQEISVTLKYYKEDFMNHPTTRLIKPYNGETERVSKHILDQIDIELVGKLSVNEWKNTISVI